MAQRGWLVDLGRCIGCHSCTVACKSEQNTAPTNSPLLFKGSNLQRPLHLSYRWVIVEEGGTYPSVWRTFVTSACNHCQTPACMNACPVDAISKRASDGIVLIDQRAAEPHGLDRARSRARTIVSHGGPGRPVRLLHGTGRMAH
jgi:tetrathionate reductase subunit B